MRMLQYVLVASMGETYPQNSQRNADIAEKKFGNNTCLQKVGSAMCPMYHSFCFVLDLLLQLFFFFTYRLIMYSFQNRSSNIKIFNRRYHVPQNLRNLQSSVSPVSKIWHWFCTILWVFTCVLCHPLMAVWHRTFSLPSQSPVNHSAFP